MGDLNGLNIIMSIIDKIFGDPNEKVIKTLRPVVEQINALEKKYQAMSDEELRNMTVEFRKKLGVENTIPLTPFIKGANSDATSTVEMVNGGLNGEEQKILLKIAGCPAIAG